MISWIRCRQTLTSGLFIRTSKGRIAADTVMENAIANFFSGKAINKSKNINGLFNKSDIFKLSAKAETSFAIEQLAGIARPTEMKKGLRFSWPLLRFIF